MVGLESRGVGRVILGQLYSSFVELGCGVGDGDERHHDGVWIDFALRCRWEMHDGDNVLVDCTADSVFLSS